MLRNCGIIRFCAEGIQFPKNFLGNEFECAADWFVLAQMMRELREMTFQSRQFLGNVGAIGEERDLLQQAFIIDSEIAVRLSGFARASTARYLFTTSG